MKRLFLTIAMSALALTATVVGHAPSAAAPPVNTDRFFVDPATMTW